MTADEVATLQARIERSRYIATYELTGVTSSDAESLSVATIVKNGDAFLAALSSTEGTAVYNTGRLSNADSGVSCTTLQLGTGETVCVVADDAPRLTLILAPFFVFPSTSDPGAPAAPWERAIRRDVAGLIGDCSRNEVLELCIAADGTVLTWESTDAGTGFRLTNRDELTDSWLLRIPYRIVTEAELEGER